MQFGGQFELRKPAPTGLLNRSVAVAGKLLLIISLFTWLSTYMQSLENSI